MDLTTVNSVKDLLGVVADVDDDSIQQYITIVSGEVETYLNRIVQTQAVVTEQIDVIKDQRIFHLKAYPVVSVASVNNDYSRVFGSSTLIAASNYYVNLQTGMLTIDRVHVTPGMGVLKVIYSGGMGLTTSAFMTAYPDISGAVATEVAYRYQRRAQIGTFNVSVGGASVNLASKTQLLPQVEEVLFAHSKFF